MSTKEYGRKPYVTRKYKTLRNTTTNRYVLSKRLFKLSEFEKPYKTNEDYPLMQYEFYPFPPLNTPDFDFDGEFGCERMVEILMDELRDSHSSMSTFTAIQKYMDTGCPILFLPKAELDACYCAGEGLTAEPDGDDFYWKVSSGNLIGYYLTDRAGKYISPPKSRETGDDTLEVLLLSNDLSELKPAELGYKVGGGVFTNAGDDFDGVVYCVLVYSHPGSDTIQFQKFSIGECSGCTPPTCTYTISYTTQAMSISTSQILTATEADPPHPSGADPDLFQWVLSGGGSLSVTSGISTEYTAPDTNPNCDNNATITLLYGGVTCDTLEIAINAVQGGAGWYVYGLICAGGYCREQVRQLLCNGSINPWVSNDLKCNDAWVSCWIRDHPYFDVSLCAGCQQPGDYIDLRVSYGNLSAGCCPPQLM